ncbi:MAG TPA: type II secretion system protein [bacterium]|nr:type II secretion system protein [bacterium]HPP88228.1 type II secretion system protein [bacterium]
MKNLLKQNIKNKSGVTLIELMVALAILSVSLIPIMSTLQFVLNKNSNTTEYTKAILTAQTVMSLLMSQSTSYPCQNPDATWNYNTNYSSLTSIGDANNPEPSPDYKTVWWWAVVTTISAGTDSNSNTYDEYKKIDLYIKYLKSGIIDPVPLQFTCYRYNLD